MQRHTECRKATQHGDIGERSATFDGVSDKFMFSVCIDAAQIGAEVLTVLLVVPLCMEASGSQVSTRVAKTVRKRIIQQRSVRQQRNTRHAS